MAACPTDGHLKPAFAAIGTSLLRSTSQVKPPILGVSFGGDEGGSFEINCFSVSRTGERGFGRPDWSGGQSGRVSGGRAEKIGASGKKTAMSKEVVDLIGAVARETRYLSPGATSAAACAGDWRRGFVLVAEGVRVTC